MLNFEISQGISKEDKVEPLLLQLYLCQYKTTFGGPD